MRRVRNGRVSAAIGSGIRDGHRVKVQGPFGTAFLRPASQSRLVLVASGTGFAPILSIAVAAIQEQFRRQIVMVVGASSIESLYMIDALCTLARYPNVTIIPVVETPQNVTASIRNGNVIDHIPELSAKDTVHACGPPRLVEATNRIAAEAGVPCYCDPFVPQDAKENMLSRALDWLNGGKRGAPMVEGVVHHQSPPLAPRQPSSAKASAFPEHAM
jgi:NAD(P)H-flavin reductase